MRPNIRYMDNQGFVRRVSRGVPFYSCRVLEELSGLRHGFSTRQGGVSAPDRALNLSRVGWDSPECVDENRRRFFGALQLLPGQVLTLRQIHSDRLHIIKDTPDHWNRPEGDALATDLTGPVLAVQTADCYPILIADSRTRAVASVHAGWKGTLARLVRKTVAGMKEAFHCDPADLVVAVGPAIRRCCFEVGAEVVDLFREQYPGFPLAVERVHKPGKYLLDLRAALNVQFEEAGIPFGNIHDLGACTRCRADEFFSYRAEGERSGRMMAVIARSCL
ncbi:MAG TPA: peptidoglycan editing factor PgeF [Acidobacteriota bacterium]|nr:peptidoglycan editing factor PgeF [Acidobacteriota bacterium]